MHLALHALAGERQSPASCCGALLDIMGKQPALSPGGSALVGLVCGVLEAVLQQVTNSESVTETLVIACFWWRCGYMRRGGHFPDPSISNFWRDLMFPPKIQSLLTEGDKKQPLFFCFLEY